MTQLNRLTDPEAIKRACEECDHMGETAFRAKYGYGKPHDYHIKLDGLLYPAKTIFGVAYGIQHPNEGPLKPSAFSGGEQQVGKKLRALGFEIELHKWEFVPGLSAQSRAKATNVAQPIEMELRREQEQAEHEKAFDPLNVEDGRKRTSASIVRRRGQQTFRNALLNAYGGRCTISGCHVLDVLEAAHIVPYRNDNTNHVTNGLLLRADLHTLFDLGLIGVDAATRTVVISENLRDSEYESLDGKLLRDASDETQRPNVEALEQHRSKHRL